MDDSTIAERLPRRTVLSRFNRKRMAPQALAANVDLVVILGSPAEPAFRPRFLDRALVLAAAAQLPALLVLNKIDLLTEGNLDGTSAGDTENEARSYFGYLAAVGFSTLVLSHKTGEGLDAVRQELRGKRAVLLGQSGVGKSTLIRTLGGAEAKTAAVSGRTQKGRHTTTTGRLYPEIGVVDTPGIRELSVYGVDRDAVDAAFPEIVRQARHCAHDNCSHVSEEGCAVRGYTSTGGDGRLESSATADFWDRRVASYQNLRTETGVEP